MSQATAAESPPPHWLMFVPAPLFAVGMGVTGLGLAWRQADAVLGWGGPVSLIVVILAAVLFAGLSGLYAAKWLRFPQAVAKEFNHPIASNFFPAFSISLMLLAAAAFPYAPGLAHGLWIVGAVLQIVLALRLIARWITHNHEIQHSNPAWFIPVVGLIIPPLLGPKLGYVELSWFFWSAGMVFWMVLFTIVMYRVIFHDPMATGFVPTLFILIAPPAVGFAGYVGLTGELDTFARILFYSGLFITLLNFAMARTFLSVPFAASWWAYTFPLDAITIAAIEYDHMAGGAFAVPLTYILLAITTVVVLGVLVRTLMAMFAGKLFVPPKH